MRKTKHFLLMTATLLCSMGASAHDFAKNGIFYKAPRQIDLADLTVMVTYFDPDNDSGYSTFKNEYRGRVVIPSTVTYEGMTFRVTRIDDYAFCECDALTSVVIPSTIVSIGESAFEGCKKLKSVALSEGLESIGYAAFRDCVSLTSIKIPNSVTEFKGSWGYNRTFEGCTNLTSVTLPRGITGIGRDRKTFEGCSKQLKINGMFYYEGIGQQVHNVTPIAPKPVSDFEFKVTANGVVLTKYNNKNKTGSLVLPEDYNGKKYDIGAGVFSGSSGLTSITLPEGVTRIENLAFFGCNGLKQATINCVHVGDWFRGNTSIKEIVLGEGVTSIGNNAFSGCSSLTSINIPNSVTSIGAGAFSGCSSLTSIILPKSLKSIGSNAFYECSSLTSVAIPKSVTSIGERAFHKCGKLTSVVLPENLRSIGYATFQNCSSLTSVTIPESVTNIGDYAFGYCSSLASVTVPQGVTSIGRNAFIWCRSLTSITIPKERAKLLNGTFGDEKVKLLVNGRKRTIHPLKNAQTPAKRKPEKKTRE